MNYIKHCCFYLFFALLASLQGLWAMEGQPMAKPALTEELHSYLTEFGAVLHNTKQKSIDKEKFSTIVSKLIIGGANPNIYVKKAYMSLLQITAYLGLGDLITLLIKHGAQLTAKLENLERYESSQSSDSSDSSDSCEELTPLHYAVMKNHFDVARLLLSYTKSADERLELFLATLPCLRKVNRHGLGIITDLLHEGAQPNIVEKNSGYNALHIAVQNKNIELVSLLLELGADPNAETYGKSSPLYWASSSKCPPEITAKLLRAGARAK